MNERIDKLLFSLKEYCFNDCTDSTEMNPKDWECQECPLWETYRYLKSQREAKQ